MSPFANSSRQALVCTHNGTQPMPFGDTEAFVYKINFSLRKDSNLGPLKTEHKTEDVMWRDLQIQFWMASFLLPIAKETCLTKIRVTMSYMAKSCGRGLPFWKNFRGGGIISKHLWSPQGWKNQSRKLEKNQEKLNFWYKIFKIYEFWPNFGIFWQKNFRAPRPNL